ncbi:Pyroglutamyl-peptidase 1 [Caenorhabditis elegans]|nr:Pyroglutamyl-peptidase 1 [Caenorhabditis elegans]CAN86605.2 Pyroglutamyl-peptidase 1 [Caenorhabditis elegans]|eukprot:NP_001122499.1 Uncharacterized protein CELE_M04C9.1 [Caenorhabditis elegans]
MCDIPFPHSREVVMIKGIAIVGFETSENATNPSNDVMEQICSEQYSDKMIFLIKFPLSYDPLKQKIDELFECPGVVAFHFETHLVKNTIYVEKKAFQSGYHQKDEKGYLPEGNKVSCESVDNTLETIIDCMDVVKKVTEKCGLDGVKFGGLKVEVSEDPGRSIGAYSYYLSLQKSTKNSIFIHVPPFGGECTKEAVVNVVKEIIDAAT